MNLRELVQEFCRRRALPLPASVISNSDPGTMQFLGILNELVEDLETRGVFQENQRVATFLTTGVTSQGDINTLAPGFVRILWESFFDNTQRLPLFGGTSAAEWRARNAFNITGPWYQYRIREDQLEFSPVVPVDHEIQFEYQSNFLIKENNGGPLPFKRYWSNDIDTFILGDTIPMAWMAWKWAQKKGFDYAEEFAFYERVIAMKLARNNTPAAINLSATNCDLRPGIFVPYGNWPVSN